jgi:hypothetical protein
MDGHQQHTAAARGPRHGRPALLVLLTITAVGDGRGGSPLPVREHYEPRTFVGHLCEDDCDSYKAGFAVADAKPGQVRCVHGSEAFRSGCRARREHGRDPVEAGCNWAIVNEIVDPADCEGAGPAFRRGCLGALLEDETQPGICSGGSTASIKLGPRVANERSSCVHNSSQFVARLAVTPMPWASATKSSVGRVRSSMSRACAPPAPAPTRISSRFNIA